MNSSPPHLATISSLLGRTPGDQDPPERDVPPGQEEPQNPQEERELLLLFHTCHVQVPLSSTREEDRRAAEGALDGLGSLHLFKRNLWSSSMDDIPRVPHAESGITVFQRAPRFLTVS